MEWLRDRGAEGRRDGGTEGWRGEVEGQRGGVGGRLYSLDWWTGLDWTGVDWTHPKICKMPFSV